MPIENKNFEKCVFLFFYRQGVCVWSVHLVGRKMVEWDAVIVGLHWLNHATVVPTLI